MKGRIIAILLILLIYPLTPAGADDGYRLWLRYDQITDKAYLKDCSRRLGTVMMTGESPVLNAAHDELVAGLGGMTGMQIDDTHALTGKRTIVLGTFQSSPIFASLLSDVVPGSVGEEGFVIRTVRYGRKTLTLIASDGERGVLYGVFHLLRLVSMQRPVDDLAILEKPATDLRLLNHWDNLDGSVERGYAGSSVWNWHLLPDYISPRYRDYARANASIGINGTVITNVNANALVLTPQYLVKVAAIADVMRPYGIKVYLTARFSAPSEAGRLATSDPLDPDVAGWWREKAGEIYALIPDFGGFLVKANSEGSPDRRTMAARMLTVPICLPMLLPHTEGW